MEVGILSGNGHILKIWPDQFAAVVAGHKKFEYRVNDRGFKVGDVLVLTCWDPDLKRYTGDYTVAVVSYMLDQGFGLPPGHVVLSITSSLASLDFARKALVSSEPQFSTFKGISNYLYY